MAVKNLEYKNGQMKSRIIYVNPHLGKGCS